MSDPLELRRTFDQVPDELLLVVETVYGDRLVSLVVLGSVERGTPRSESEIDTPIVADPLPGGRMRRVEEFDT